LTYLGHLVTQDSIQALPTKVKAISKWPQPTSVKTLRQFLSLTGFYRHFIKNYGDIAVPLTDLTGSTLWHWGSKQQAAFETLVLCRGALCTAPVLAYPDPDRPFVIGTDASGFAIGATLQQDHGKGLQPVAYLSHKLSEAQRKYPVQEKELLASMTSPWGLAEAAPAATSPAAAPGGKQRLSTPRTEDSD
jgi:hypothetical protein